MNKPDLAQQRKTIKTQSFLSKVATKVVNSTVTVESSVL